jgi:Peptidase M50B-like
VAGQGNVSAPLTLVAAAGLGVGVLALSHDLTPLPRSVAVPVGLLVLFAFAAEGIWRLARHISVIAHEGAHAVAGWSMGGRVTGVTLKSDATGETTTLGLSGLGGIITGFVGYLGPSICGLTAAGLIALDHIGAVLRLAVIFLIIMLLLVRNFFGAISVILNGALLYLVLRDGSAGVQTVAAYALSWFMLLSGVRWVLMHGSNASDAGILRRMTYIPRVFWVVLWLVGSVTALWFGGHLLLM